MGVSLLAILLASAPERRGGSQSPSLAEEIQGSARPQNVQGLKIPGGGKEGYFLIGGKKNKDKIQ